MADKRRIVWAEPTFVYQRFKPTPTPDPQTIEDIHSETHSVLGTVTAIALRKPDAEILRSLFLHCHRLQRTFPRFAEFFPSYGPQQCAHDGIVKPSWHAVVIELGFRTLVNLRCFSPQWPDEFSCSPAQELEYAATFAREVMRRFRPDEDAGRAGHHVDFRELRARLNVEVEMVNAGHSDGPGERDFRYRGGRFPVAEIPLRLLKCMWPPGPDRTVDEVESEVWPDGAGPTALKSALHELNNGALLDSVSGLSLHQKQGKIFWLSPRSC